MTRRGPPARHRPDHRRDRGGACHGGFEPGALSIEAFAEGIERLQEFTLLQREDCDSGQGFLFARPLEAAEAEAFPRDWRSETPSVPAA